MSLSRKSDAGIPATTARKESIPSTAAPFAERYVIERVLGRGGMATVYLAYDTKHERRVAVKAFTPDAGVALGVERFQREIRVIAGLQHPNILPLHDSGEWDGVLYYVMPFVEGESLRDRLTHDVQLPIDETVRLVCQVCDALGYAHERGVVHRDIKPANILLSVGHALLADFGIARSTGERAEALTERGLSLGTPEYMSPEQASGDMEVDRRSDIYSLGCVMYELLAGTPPYSGSSAQAIIVAHFVDRVPTLGGVRPDVSPALAAAIERAMAKEPDARFATTHALAETIRDSGTQARIGSSRDVARPFASRTNLPAQSTRLLGREEELRVVGELLARRDVRIVTLTGPGGSGKSRMSVELAAQAHSAFDGGTFLVPLAAIREPGLVPGAIASIVGIRETSGRATLESLTAFLRERPVLLLLDNFEQVVDAGPIISALLESAPRLKVLVTSRIPLRIRGEREVPVPPLAIPDLSHLPPVDELSRFAAVELFVERARAVNPRFSADEKDLRIIAEICDRLDGLPLAIELAAARSKLLTPRNLLARLGNRLQLLTGGTRDAPERHQTLRRAIAWSYDLLSTSDQTLFRRLCVFVGGCELDAVEAVCRGDGGMDVFDGLSSLCDKSLLRQVEEGSDEQRFSPLETIREYGTERLLESGEENAIRARHCEFYLTLAERGEPHLAGSEQRTWLASLAREDGNLRSAMDWAERHNGALALRLGRALWRFWLVHGDLTEGRERLGRLMSLPEAIGRTETRARLLTGLAMLMQNQTGYTAPRALMEESVSIWREIGDKNEIATALNHLGWLAFRHGEYERAEILSGEALALHRHLGNQRGIAVSLNNLGWIEHYRGSFAAAREYHEQALDIRRKIGDIRGTGFSLTNLGHAEHRLGNAVRAGSLLAEAEDLLRAIGDKQLLAWAIELRAEVLYDCGDSVRAVRMLEQDALVMFRSIGDRFGTAHTLSILGKVARDSGQLGRAEALQEESLALWRAIDANHGAAETMVRLAGVVAARGDRERAKLLYAEAANLFRSFGVKHGMARCLAGLSDIAANERVFERAALLLGMADAIDESTGRVISKRSRTRRDALAAHVREALGEGAFTTAWLTGKATEADVAAQCIMP